MKREMFWVKVDVCPPAADRTNRANLVTLQVQPALPHADNVQTELMSNHRSSGNIILALYSKYLI